MESVAERPTEESSAPEAVGQGPKSSIQFAMSFRLTAAFRAAGHRPGFHLSLRLAPKCDCLSSDARRPIRHHDGNSPARDYLLEVGRKIISGGLGLSARVRSDPVASPQTLTTPVNTSLSGLTSGRLNAPSLARGGIIVERRQAPALDRDKVHLDYHYLLAWEGAPVVTEQAHNGRQSAKVTKRPGTLSLGLTGELAPVRFHAPFQVIACLFDPAWVRTLLEEQDRPSHQPFHAHTLSEDTALATLAQLLAAEAESEDPDRLYQDHLALALASRFVANLQRRPEAPRENTAQPLSAARLRRVVDRMTSDFSKDLSLDLLAEESGYSRAHFLRMFRSATGSTPHRYLRDRRLEAARDRLATGSESIIEIAYGAGFSSHSHLTRLFHERFGVTPSEFRRGN